MKELLNRVSTIFELEENSKYQKSQNILLNKESSEGKLEKAKRTILKLVYNEYYGNEMYSCYASKTEKAQIKKHIKKIEETEEIDSSLFINSLTTFADAAEYSKMGYYIDMCLDVLKSENKELKIPEITDELKDITKATLFDMKISSINYVLATICDYTHKKIKEKYTKDGKLVPAKVQSSLNQFLKLGTKATNSLIELNKKNKKHTPEMAFNNVVNFLNYGDKFKETKKEVKEEPKTKDKKKTINKKTKKESKIQKIVAIITSKDEKKKNKKTSKLKERIETLFKKKKKKKATKKSKLKLIRKEKSGKIKKKSESSIHPAARFVAGGLAVSIFGLGAYALFNSTKPLLEPKKDKYAVEDDAYVPENTVKEETEITEENTITETPSNTIQTNTTQNSVSNNETTSTKQNISNNNQNNYRNTEINLAATSVYQNWAQFGVQYSKEDIAELIKLLNGQSSSITISEGDDMLITVINNATVPAVNNIIGNTNTFKTAKIELSSLFIDDDWAGIEAIERIENYLNGMLINSAHATNYAKQATNHQNQLANGQTVDGLNLTNNLNKPSVRLVYARAAIGANALTGVIDETQTTVDWQWLENIAKKAKTDMGEITKSYTK